MLDKSKFKMFKFKHHKIIRNKFSLLKDFNFILALGINFQNRKRKFIIKSKLSKMKLALLLGLLGLAVCADNDIEDVHNWVHHGKDNHIKGKFNSVGGYQNVINGYLNDVEGDKNNVKGDENVVDGNVNFVMGSGNLVMGQGNVVSDGTPSSSEWADELQNELKQNFKDVEE
jgi:hypothetical protein